jgi:hypothetical protein
MIKPLHIKISIPLMMSLRMDAAQQIRLPSDTEQASDQNLLHGTPVTYSSL